MPTPSNPARRWTRALPLLAFLPIVLASSCKLLSSAANAPGKVASGMFGGSKDSADKIPPNVVQGSVMRFADTFAARITQASNDFATKVGTREARIQSLTWTIGQCSAAFSSAAGPNAKIALLDMVVLVTLGRSAHEEYWMPKVWGEADRPMVDAFTALEKDVWNLAETIFTKAQGDKIRSVVAAWREENPDMGITAFVRLPTFQDIIKTRPDSGEGAPALGDLLSVDPLSGLEPAVREIERTRLFGERSMFYVQRASLILAFQVELLGLKLMVQPEVRSTFEGGERVSLAAASLAETAAKLPEAVRAEREAAVKQISDELSLQRQGILADLAKAEEPAGKMLVEARATLEAGERMSTALQGAIGSLDAFLAGLRKEDPPSATPPPEPEEPGKPFDVSEYGVAAGRVEGAARELQGLVATLDQSLPQVRHAVDEAVAGSDRAVDHAFVRGLQLGGALIGGVALAVLLVRWISARILASKPRRAAA